MLLTKLLLSCQQHFTRLLLGGDNVREAKVLRPLRQLEHPSTAAAVEGATACVVASEVDCMPKLVSSTRVQFDRFRGGALPQSSGTALFSSARYHPCTARTQSIPSIPALLRGSFWAASRFLLMMSFRPLFVFSLMI